MSRSLREIFNEGNPNKVDAAVQSARLGTLLSLGLRFFRGTVTTNVLTLPENARALALVYVRSVAGTTTDRLAIDSDGGTPAAGSATINPVGNVLFAAADAVTEAEVGYFAAEGDVVEDVITCASNQGTLLASRKALHVLEVTRLAGTDIGAATVVERGTAPADNQAAANDDGALILFNAADGVTQARVKYIAIPGQGTAKVAVVPDLDVVDRQF